MYQLCPQNWATLYSIRLSYYITIAILYYIHTQPYLSYHYKGEYTI